MPASPRTPVIGLRERKKEKTRVAIQEHALRLFRKNGYDETTVEDIAAAAEISPSTFFRYFPTKEDVVMYDPLDDVFIGIFLAQPADLSALEAFRATLRDAFRRFTPAVVEAQEQRDQLARSVPALRARMLEEFVNGIALLATAIAARTGRRRDDPEVKIAAGAIGGIFMQYWADGTHHHFSDYARAIDRALKELEDGLPLLNTRSRPARRAAR